MPSFSMKCTHAGLQSILKLVRQVANSLSESAARVSGVVWARMSAVSATLQDTQESSVSNLRKGQQQIDELSMTVS